MTSPASGAGSAPDLPDYAPTTRSAQSETRRAASPAAKAGGGNRRQGLALLVIATAQLMVVLDATIVNVALPDIQRRLASPVPAWSGWSTPTRSPSAACCCSAAAPVTFLAAGGCSSSGCCCSPRRPCSAGSPTSQWWLLAARAIQGVGGAVIAPTALALITTNFPEGGPRNKAFGVYSAMAGGGSALGLLLGGVLTTYASWRWVLFVNVPIGIWWRAAAARVLAEIAPPAGPDRRGRRDHRHRRRRAAGLRPVQGRHRAGRGIPLG